MRVQGSRIRPAATFDRSVDVGMPRMRSRGREGWAVTTPTDSEWHAHMSKCLVKLSQGQREDFLERAGIMEYDGGLDRKDAARRAWRIVV